jgi:hypothetical protein
MQLTAAAHRHRTAAFVLVIVVATVLSVLAIEPLQILTKSFFADGYNLSTLKTLLAALGSALIGAAAIAFSLILFAMQVNVERMPHGLFKRLSSDRRLLGAFIASFLIAMTVAAASLIPDRTWAVPALLLATWGTVAMLALFLFAYRRALSLINPIEQLSIMVRSARRDLMRWNRRAEHAVVLIEDPQGDAKGDGQATFNAPKAHFFNLNNHWDDEARRAIEYATSYARRFAENGDHEVTKSAINGIMVINATYCAVKSGTFVGSNGFFEVQGTTDGFINTTLEHLRKTMRIALASSDEQLAENTMRGIAALYGVYLKIEYPGRNPTRTHANLASGYLQSAVESVVPHSMPDVMMEGIRLMGRAAQTALGQTESNEIVSLSEKIALLSYVGVVKADHRPVALTAFEQLAAITYDLILKPGDDIRFSVRRLRSAINEAAKRFLATADSQLISVHSSNLAPYFSSTSATSLRARLTSLVNEALEAQEDNTRAAEVIANIEVWADQLYIEQKELLLLAVNKRSGFTFDVLHWAVGISEILIALSTAAACPDRIKPELQKHALWLVSTLSFLPDDEESVSFAENYSVTELLFEAAEAGFGRDCVGYYEGCKGLLMSWARKGGRNETGWHILETATYGLVALTVNEESPQSVVSLKAKFAAMLASDGAPPPDIRDRTARELRRSAQEYRRADIGYSRIDRALARRDQAAVNALLLELADMFSPA